MARRKLSVSSTRDIYTYVYLYHAANFSMEQAVASEEGRLYNCMSSIILSAFCIEAYLNHIGRELLPYWDDDIIKDISPSNKLKIICHHLDLQVDFSHRPFQAFKSVFKFRNLMAHGKSATLSEKRIQNVRDGERPKFPEIWWEKQCQLGTAKQLLTDTESMIVKIHKAAGKSDSPFIVFGFGTYLGAVVK